MLGGNRHTSVQWGLSTRLAVALEVLAFLFLASSANAIEFLEGRVQVHGAYEMQLRTIARDLDMSDGLDLTQWYNIINLEIEADIAPDGWGPFDLISAFARIEGRYDCVWRRGCGLFPNVSVYGDRPERQPKRLSDGRRAGFRSTGQLYNGDERFFRDIPRESLPYRFRDRDRGSRVTSPLFNIGGIDTLFDSPGADGVFGNEDDPAPFYFSEILADECEFNFRKRHGSQDGVGVQIMGPWQPACTIRPTGKLAGKPNPFSSLDFSPITGDVGSGALPYRPAPEASADEWAPKDVARGVYYPNERLAQALREGRFDGFDQNFTVNELQWNQGASQQDEKALKELYFDIEAVDSRLWLRLGKQTIVWGKTELFRNQDQWNPQDLALASLPSLEDSRIALWAGRAVWSFWNVGPLEDVRAEFVVLMDQFEPTDLGRCGEPYAPNPVCDKTFGLFIHGLTGLTVAGERRPPNPWNSWHGVEAGVRVEWRYNRFSFAVSDYYGFTDMPYQDTLFRYSRNVDPKTGRPRHTMADGTCRTGREAACLQGKDALTRHSVNQQVFTMICATSIGFSTLDLSACGQSVFNSHGLVDSDDAMPGLQSAPLPVSGIVGTIGSGQPVFFGGNVFLNNLGGFTPATLAAISANAPFGLTYVNINTGNPEPAVLVPLVTDPNDGPQALVTDYPADVQAALIAGGALFPTFFLTNGLSPFLSDEQEALLGCGPYYDTNCDIEGIDLLNAEASVLYQSFPGIEGTFGSDWDTTDRGLIQPGTIGFEGGPICTRFDGGSVVILPGCRGPGDSGYDPRVDGTTGGALHPFVGQPWRTEMGIFSWNLLMALVALSTADDPSRPTESDFDAAHPFRRDGCSFAKPQFCNQVQSFFQITGIQRNAIRAGGNGRFGRRDFTWHGGRDLVLRYEKRNILGFAMDFAEDRTKSNIGVEFTWENDVHLADWDRIDGLTEVDQFNLTISVDRPTFINFMNANRTFFINTQWFFRYTDGYQESFPTNGPWNILAVLAVNTGYFDDRLNPSVQLVYDVHSNSSAAISQLTYRYTADFSVTFGFALFQGREESRTMPLVPNALSNRVGRHSNKDFVENGLAAVRDRDEFFLRIRYTF
ncbi:MAG: hypothetical protein JRG95_09255 [Deltaproteobacteria bacterium]|nr:hypothetical protein [Deltaproteobacteria bacterium]